jgi:ribose transport system substrate-binding protein
MLRSRLMTTSMLVLAAGAIFAGCGGGSSSSSAETPTTASAGSGSELVTPPAESPPTAIPTLAPLPKLPPTGVKVANLQCDYPICKTYSETFQEAAKKLGWSVKTIVYKTGQPQSAMEQAVSDGVDYITISGAPLEVMEPQVAKAHAAGIGIVSCCDPTEPDPSIGWLAEVSNQYGNSESGGEGLARWMINDSEGTANAVVIGLPEIPIVATTPKAVERVFEEECPECTATELGVTGEELASGTMPAKVVAYLQGHPEVNYVIGSFGELLTGVPQAIQQAGFSDKVKLAGMQVLLAPEAKELKAGEVDAWYTGGNASWGFFWADAIARTEEGMKLPQKIYGEQPQRWLCTTATADECTEWEGPAGYKQQFYKLWNVG